MKLLLLCVSNVSLLSSRAAPNPDSAPGGGAVRPGGKDPSGRRKDEAKQTKQKPKEKENALLQFDLNNYASERDTHTHTPAHTH